MWSDFSHVEDNKRRNFVFKMWRIGHWAEGDIVVLRQKDMRKKKDRKELDANCTNKIDIKQQQQQN